MTSGFPKYRKSFFCYVRLIPSFHRYLRHFTRNDGHFSVADEDFPRIICTIATTNINIFLLMIEIFQQYLYNKIEFYEDKLLNE